MGVSTTIPIPLRPGDTDVRLDLRALLDRIYEESGYEDYLYTHDPDPPLSPADAAWARSVLSGRPEDRT